MALGRLLNDDFERVMKLPVFVTITCPAAAVDPQHLARLTVADEEVAEQRVAGLRGRQLVGGVGAVLVVCARDARLLPHAQVRAHVQVGHHLGVAADVRPGPRPRPYHQPRPAGRVRGREGGVVSHVVQLK